MRKRYIALQIDNKKNVNEKQLMKTIWGKIYELFGEVGASQTALSKIDYDSNRGILIIRCAHKKLDETIAAIATITEINELLVVPQIVSISGTLKALKQKLSKYMEAKSLN